MTTDDHIVFLMLVLAFAALTAIGLYAILDWD